MRYSLSVIQSFQEKQLSDTCIRSGIVERTKIHHLLQKMMAKFILKKKQQLIASITVKMIHWIGALHLLTKC